MILVVEKVTSWFDFDELSNYLFLRNVGENNVLRILVQNCEAVGNLGVLLFFLLFN